MRRRAPGLGGGRCGEGSWLPATTTFAKCAEVLKEDLLLSSKRRRDGYIRDPGDRNAVCLKERCRGSCASDTIKGGTQRRTERANQKEVLTKADRLLQMRVNW